MQVNIRKLGRNIKQQRQKRGLSQELLARYANIKLSNLAKLEGGFNNNPTLSTLVSLSKVLTNGSIDQLLK